MRKYLAIATMALSLASVGTFAQDAQTAAPAQTNASAVATQQNNGGRGLDKLAQKLNLNDDQKQQLKPIFAERRQKMQELRSSNESKTDKHKQARQIIADSDTKVKGVLTADQFTQYQQLREQMRENHKANRQQQTQPQAQQQ